MWAGKESCLSLAEGTCTLIRPKVQPCGWKCYVRTDYRDSHFNESHKHLYLNCLLARATTPRRKPTRTPCDSWGAECGLKSFDRTSERTGSAKPCDKQCWRRVPGNSDIVQMSAHIKIHIWQHLQAQAFGLFHKNSIFLGAGLF